MYLQLVREVYGNTFTKGKLFVNGTFVCYTLEDKVRDFTNDIKVYGKTAIPSGSYTVELSVSTRFGILLPILLDVPYFAGIRIHSGNSAKDTDGCILVGLTNDSPEADWIGKSKAAMAVLLPLLEKSYGNELITIEVV